jgi:OmpA-OmpF porin, OOP family
MKQFGWVLAAVLALISAPAMSADDSGFYFGVGAGMFGVQEDDFESSDFHFNDDDTGLRAFGGWQINQNFGIEAGYVDGGTASDSLGVLAVDGFQADVDIDVTEFDLYVTGKLPLGEMFYAYAKAGMVFWQADASATLQEDDGEGGVITTELSDSSSGNDPAYGAGFGMNIGENAGVQVEYVVFDVENTNVNFLSANFVWRFR